MRSRQENSEGGAWKTGPALWRRLKPLARRMRRKPTPTEQTLWQQLRNRNVNGSKFRRQHAVGRFVVDFYCAEAELVVEVDGPIHESSIREDVIRQEYLESRGLTVMRFSTEAVEESLEGVVRRISEAL